MTDPASDEWGNVHPANDPKNVNLDYTALETLSEKQLLWNIHKRLRSIQTLVAVLVAVTLLSIIGGAILTVQAVNSANDVGGF